MTFSIFVAHPSALLTDHLPHGDGLVAHGFIHALAERGHTLHVAAQEVSLRRALPPNVELHVLGGGARGPLSRLQYMRRMRRLFRDLRRTTEFDLVHQLNPVDAGLSLALADAKEPVILGPYVPAWPAWSDPGATALAARLAEAVATTVRRAQQRRATTVLLSTPAAAAKLQAPVPERLRVRELSAGIDEQVWRPGDGEAPRQDVLFLANLERRKGMFVLLDAFARLAKDLPDARLLVAGTGSQADAVRSTVRQSAVAGQVELLGHVPRERVPDLMRACAVHCAPAFGEPFGMTVLEAMACAKPVVVTDAGGVRYLVGDRGGRRVPPRDSNALAAALRELLCTPELRREMGGYNRRLIEQRYTWTRVIDRLEEAYDEALALARSR